MIAALIPGVVAEFDEPDALASAVLELCRRGYRDIEVAAHVVPWHEPTRTERFFVSVDAGGPSFDGPRLAAELLALGAVRVTFQRAGAHVQTESYAPYGHVGGPIP